MPSSDERIRKTLGRIDDLWLLSAKKFNRLQRSLGLGIKTRSPHQAIYHCCVQKTASQWFKWLLRDHAIYRYTGLTTERYTDLGLKPSSTYHKDISADKIGVHLYTCFENYERIAKPVNHQTIFVTRDPRDIVVSFYFSTKYSHPKMSYISRMRTEMEGMDKHDGLCYVVDQLIELGLFEAQRSWMSCQDSRVKVFRFESLAANHSQFMRDVFEHLRIVMPEREFEALAGRHSFSVRAKGRSQGDERIKSHYRKGVANDWKNHLTSDTLDYFRTRTGDLVEALGYAS